MKHGMKGRLALGAIMAAVLAACSGSDVRDGGGASVTLNGLAATGAPIANAAIATRCVSGGGSTNSAADGTFTVTLADPALPCLVQVRKDGWMLHGFATQGGRVNVTPLTELLVARAAGGDPAQAFASFDAARAAALQAGLDVARAYVQDQASALAGGLITGDPLTKPFSIGDADDRLLDNLVSLLAQAGLTVADLGAAAAAGGDLRAAMPPEESRPHDGVAYFVNPADAIATTFAALPAAASDAVDMNATSRWAGILEGAAYRIEVPANWNGELVMYAHGYAGEGLELRAVDSAIRRHLVQHGYAWAASSYSRNSYDVRAGIEDTNLLARNFNTIAAARGRSLAAPSRTYIIGHSMGGHVAAAAVEAETYATARHKVRYDGAMPMCGVVGDTALFDTFAGLQAAAHVLGGQPSVSLDQWSSIKSDVTTALFGTATLAPPITPTPTAGMAYASVVQNLTGGARPLFDLGLGVGSFTAPYGLFGTTTVTTGLTTRSVSDTTSIVYKVDGQDALSADLNAVAPRAVAPDGANRLRWDGLRWIPKVQGQLMAPVVSLHTLGDLFVPFGMQQLYRRRAEENRAGHLLVQRAIRGVSHCDFTIAEMSKAFTDMVAWVKQGTPPVGDDVLTPATVANTAYGCSHTSDALGPDETSMTPGSVGYLRALIAMQGRSCTP